MKLTFKDIISATNGIVRFKKNDFELELYRFTKKQERFFYKTHPAFKGESFFDGYFGTNCKTGAGITLDFISDCSALKINFSKVEYAKLQKPRKHFLDLYVDKKFAKAFEVESQINYISSGKKTRFTLYFPSYAKPIISSIELENATIFEPQKKQIEILFLGDSITQGAFAINPSNSYVMRVARELDIGILNQGNSGFVYDKGSIEKVCEPKIIVTAYGINDINRKNIQAIEKDTSKFLALLKKVYKNSKIVSILPLWTMQNSSEQALHLQKRNCLKSVYEKYSNYILDGYDIIPHEAKYFDDEVHPNDEGFAYYGEFLTKELKKIL